MADTPSLSQLPLFPESFADAEILVNRPLWHVYDPPGSHLPDWIAECSTAQRYLDLLGPLHWDQIPERNLQRDWGQPTIPFASFISAELVRLEEGLGSAKQLRRFLIEHPAFISLRGLPRHTALDQPLGFNVLRSVPTPRHFNRMLRTMPNTVAQAVLADSIQLIVAELHHLGIERIGCISLDTKHILAWVKENNHKAYVPDRFNKSRQPAGDRDCRLGCKRRRNQGTPTTNPRSAAAVKVGEYYWGYASGLAVCKLPDLGEFVLAELTQPFDQGDLSYFFPLIQQVEHRLGCRPNVGTFDAAFDAWYVYAHFYEAADSSCFAAIPFSEKGGYKAGRQFSPDGLPLCAAGLPMPRQLVYLDRTTCLVPHERGRYVCPLQYPQRTARRCPAHDARWAKGGCTAAMPTSIGARLRYTLDRKGEAYQTAYRQRTAVERINSQAKALGIERPHLRNRAAIANQNTLIYTLINLRFLQRLRHHRLSMA